MARTKIGDSFYNGDLQLEIKLIDANSGVEVVISEPLRNINNWRELTESLDELFDEYIELLHSTLHEKGN